MNDEERKRFETVISQDERDELLDYPFDDQPRRPYFGKVAITLFVVVVAGIIYLILK